MKFRNFKKREKTVPTHILGSRVRVLTEMRRKSGEFQASENTDSKAKQKPLTRDSFFATTNLKTQQPKPFSESSIIMYRKLIQENPSVAKLFQLFRLRQAKE